MITNITNFNVLIDTDAPAADRVALRFVLEDHGATTTLGLSGEVFATFLGNTWLYYSATVIRALLRSACADYIRVEAQDQRSSWRLCA